MISPVFWRLWLLVRLGFEGTTSRSADECSSSCANRAVLIYFVILQELFISLWTCLLFSSSSKGFTPSTERNISKHYFIDSVLEARTNGTRERRTGSFWNIVNQKYIFPTVKSALLLLLDFKGWTYTEAEYFTVMHELFSLGFTLHKCFGGPYPHHHFSYGPLLFLLVVTLTTR